MRTGLRRLLTGMVVGGLVLTGTPAPAAAGEPGTPVSLVVGLRPGAGTDAPVDRLEAGTGVDVVDAEPIAGDTALTVDVPAGDVTEAAAALRGDPAVAYVEVDHVARVAATPNDPAYARQWGLTRARVATAWDTVRGAANVVIAVVDTGVTPLPDLAGRMLPGYDFVNDDTNATDDEGHGTMTAGVLAAGGNNSLGVAGVCWYCKILPVKVLGADGSGSYSDIAEGIRYAADRGADIVNLSLGGSADSALLREAVAYAAGKGALVVAAAGNDGSRAAHFPAAIPSVLAVGASTAGDARYPWSNHGADWVDIAAPGCNLAQSRTGALGDFCGTSSATPFVAGVAGLLAATTPTPTAAQIRGALTSSTVRLAGSWVATGRVDAAAALRALPFWFSGVTAGAVLRGPTTLRTHVRAGSGITSVSALLGGRTVAVARTAPWTLTVNPAAVTGRSTLTIVARSGATTVATATLPVTVDRVAPVVTVRLPGASALVRGAVGVGVDATDASGVHRVELLVAGRVVAVDAQAPFALPFNSVGRTGPVALTVRAVDRAGNVAAVTRTVTVDNQAPGLVVTAGPASGARAFGAGTVRLAASATDARGIRRLELLVNGVIAGRYAGATHTFSVSTTRYGRTMAVRIRAYDRAGNVRYTPVRTWYR